MRLAGVDLNLLTALDALLETRNVTHAARKLGITQPAVSHNLRRLRELLGDPLLVRTPTGMQATPRALELRPAVRAALDAAETVLQPAPAFDPASAARTFAVSMADQAAYQLLPTLIPQLATVAPGVAIEVRPPPPDTAVALTEGNLELGIGVFRDAPPGIRNELLMRETFACAVRRDGPNARGKFELKHFLARPHALVAPLGRPGSVLDKELARRGLSRRIVVTVPHFLVVPALIASSDLVWTGPATLVRQLARTYPLAVRPPPLDIPGFEVTMRWSVRLDRDPGLAWLRGMLRAAIAHVDRPRAS